MATRAPEGPRAHRMLKTTISDTRRTKWQHLCTRAQAVKQQSILSDAYHHSVAARAWIFRYIMQPTGRVIYSSVILLGFGTWLRRYNGRDSLHPGLVSSSPCNYHAAKGRDRKNVARETPLCAWDCSSCPRHPQYHCASVFGR